MNENKLIQCVERVYPSDRWGAFYPHQCSRKGVVERETGWYCAQHDPVVVAERRAASSAKYQAERDKRNAEHELQKRKNAAWDALVEFLTVGNLYFERGALYYAEFGKSSHAVDYGESGTPWDAVLDLVEKVNDNAN
jgi:hypothetical protein